MAGAELPSRHPSGAAPSMGEPASGVADTSGWTAGQYRRVFGWAIEQGDRRVLLALEGGMVALVVPRSLAVDVVRHLERLDTCGPVLAVGTERPYWIFLADANGYLATHEDLPRGVEVLDCAQRIPVPCRDRHCVGLRWVVAPDSRRRWLPTLATVVLAIRSGPAPDPR